MHTVESLAVAQSRASGSLLSQYLVTCPTCVKPAAAHIDENHGARTLVRFICPDSCAYDAAGIIAALEPAGAMAELSA